MMVNYDGKNFNLYEIEQTLLTHPDILKVQVVDVPDPKSGEELVVWIIPKENSNLTAESIKQYCKGKISEEHIPKYIKFVDEYPTTASGKIQKFRLREKAIQIISDN